MDVGERYDEAVSFLYDDRVVKGISATKFGTQQTLTRGDAAVILANWLGLDTESAPDAGFKDLNPRVKGSVNALAEIDVISGVTKTDFRPGQPLSRGAMAKILVTAYDLDRFAKQTPFTDVGGVFKPYVESLYRTGITMGKTATSYGTNLNVTRGEFANLLYGTLLFILDTFYYPFAESATITSSTTTQIVLEKVVPAHYTAEEIGKYLSFTVVYSDGTKSEFEPVSYSLSDDRHALTISHENENFAGKKGTLIVGEIDLGPEASFDFTAVKTSSSANVKSSFEYGNKLLATKADEQ
ncbi:S-layer homology domain-containing protein [Bacillus sp. 37MA]|uniref:S-layer homology domain-containing protein n=1 Tax=Bacillus sp. 37MA TaxID=1132442 RepID=UPI000364F133|nr:S-layer homology domain-containing protein [Bacillus sp. 37MA]